VSKPGEIVRAKVSAKKTRYRGAPRAVITITQSRGRIHVNCRFEPTAKMTGPLEPAHAAAAAAITAITASAKGES
jgi:hypothetical protein